MPIFEYKCNKCGEVTEFLEKTAVRRKHICSKCNSKDLQKLLSGFAVGQSKSTNQICESCPDGECLTGGCGDEICPYNVN
ncbi:FmdB family zinc ribbon protein [Planctomycetota bacterium]